MTIFNILVFQNFLAFLVQINQDHDRLFRLVGAKMKANGPVHIYRHVRFVFALLQCVSSDGSMIFLRGAPNPKVGVLTYFLPKTA